MDNRTFVRYAFTWIVMVGAVSSAFGQARDQSRLAVDVINLKSHKQIRGFVLSAKATEEVRVAVSREWLEKEAPDTFLKDQEAAMQEDLNAKLHLRDRLKNLINKPAQINDPAHVLNGAFLFFVRKELERIESEIENPPDDECQFLVLKIKPAAVSGINVASEANRRIAIWSWHERLSDIELRKPSSLVTELKSKKIDPALIPPDLASRFYATDESEDQWRMRRAIVSQQLDQPIEFQGSGDVMIQLGNDKRPDTASLMGQMMQSQMNSLLQELSGNTKKLTPNKLDDADWTKSAISQAEKIKASYFRATNVRMDRAQASANVESAFLAKLESGRWILVWHSSTDQSASQQKEDTIKRIANDPQVKAIQTQFEALGIAGAGLDQAIQMGAATMTAQRMVNDEFQQFVERHLKQLNSPPILMDVK